ncbi:ATP-binding protein [Streptomyces sp. NPDC048290]|uniref:ATP-binding protein n=1 Tax=Streptomyces sp. NPDC048290 TaxID=3155811 RepID=UPI00341B5B79
MTLRLTLRKLPYAFKVAADAQAVGPARRLVREAVESLDLGQQAPSLDDLELLATELVTNAVVHTMAPCVVCIRWTGRRIRVEVTDTDTRDVEARVPPANDEHGRGLFLVDVLAADWGSYREPAGKTTWFELAAPSEDLLASGAAHPSADCREGRADRGAVEAAYSG